MDRVVRQRVGVAAEEGREGWCYGCDPRALPLVEDGPERIAPPGATEAVIATDSRADDLHRGVYLPLLGELLAPLAFPAVVAVAIVLRHPRGRLPDLPVPVVLAPAEDELHTVGVQLLEVGSILQPGLRRTEFSRWRLLSQKS